MQIWNVDMGVLENHIQNCHELRSMPIALGVAS